MSTATTKFEQLAEQLEERIAAGVYAPGERIPSVRRLQRQHGVSISTVVEACRLLEARRVITSRPRSGFFVCRPERSAAAAPTPPRAPTRSRLVAAPLSLRLNLGIGSPQRPTLGAAVQGPELMAVPALNRLMSHVLRLHPRECHSYDSPPGSPALRRAIAHRGEDSGCVVDPDDVVITNGAKEAVYLSIRAATRPGDTVVIESPAYYALLEVLASLGLRAIEVPHRGDEGIDLDVLERVLERHTVAAVALVSNYSNPTGSCMTDQAKRRLVDVIERHGIALVEDDVYGDLAFDGVRPKAIKAFDRTGSVLYCASYSKSVSPGMRIGWAIPGRFQTEVEHLKLVVNQSAPTAPQLALASFVESGGFDRHLRRVRRAYAEQMHRVVDAVERLFPDDTRHTSPMGGHVLWVQTPGVDSLALYEAAAAQAIHVAPGPLFSASGGFIDCLRLNTGFPYTDDIERQLTVVAALVREHRTLT